MEAKPINVHTNKPNKPIYCDPVHMKCHNKAKSTKPNALYVQHSAFI